VDKVDSETPKTNPIRERIEKARGSRQRKRQQCLEAFLKRCFCDEDGVCSVERCLNLLEELKQLIASELQTQPKERPGN
jgi:hypothetical protein